MSAKQVRFQPYKLATEAEGTDNPTTEQRAQGILHSRGFDGVTINAQYTDPGEGDTPGYTLTPLFWDESLSTQPDGEVFFEDKSQEVVNTTGGNDTYKFQTDGRPMLIRITALTGTTPQLVLQQGAYAGYVV